MVSQNRRRQALAVFLATAVFLVGASFIRVDAGTLSEPLEFGLLLVFNFIALAGTHVYHGLQGTGGVLPVSAHWRYVGAVVGVLVLSAVAWTLHQVDPIAGAESGALFGGAALLLGNVRTEI